MTELKRVGTEQFMALGIGAAIAVIVPIVIAVIWTVRKKERFTTVLAGAAAFLLFAVVLEKTIQNVLVFPTQMGLDDHAVSQFINARPILWAFVVGLFPGVFEETGRLITFKTVLRNRRNRETSISYGIGHGGIEVLFILGSTYITYIVYGLMINSGSFQTIVDQAAAQAPDQVEAIYSTAAQIAGIGFADISLGLAERVFAFLFHVGASILVFYAARDKGRFWLYPLAVLLHTAMDTFAALCMTKVIVVSTWAVQAVVAAAGILIFFSAWILLYKRDKE